MVRTTITQITDDIDGSKNAETYSFAWQGTEYEVDLSNKNFKAFDKLLQPYIEAGRKVSKRASGRGSSSASTSKRDLSAIREWARAEGIQISDRGRVPKAIIDQYNASN
jgi:hypothetical protein